MKKEQFEKAQEIQQKIHNFKNDAYFIEPKQYSSKTNASVKRVFDATYAAFKKAYDAEIAKLEAEYAKLFEE